MKVHEKSIRKLNEKIKLLTSRSKIGKINLTYEKIKQLVLVWINYFKLTDMKSWMGNITKPR
ncbi:MAG: group II intron maturase-specific domain-containing protein [Sedimentibacter sp.]